MKTFKEVEEEFNTETKKKFIALLPDDYYMELIEYITENYLLIRKNESSN